MTDPERIVRDQATILAIKKVILILIVVAASLYLGVRLVLILMPFVIGFILARVSWIIVLALRSLAARLPGKKLNPQAPAAGSSDGSADQATAKPAENWTDNVGKERAEQTDRRDRRFKLFVFSVLIILFVGMMAGLVTVGVRQLRALFETLPNLLRNRTLFQPLVDMLNNLSNVLGGFLAESTMQSLENQLLALQDRLLAQIPAIAAVVLGGATSFVAGLPATVFILIVIVMSGYYYIIDMSLIRRALQRNITNRRFRQQSIHLINSLSASLFRVIGGYLLLMIITFIMSWITLSAVGLRYAVVLAVLAAIVDFLPVLGLSTTMLPIAIYLIATGNVIGGIGVIIGLVAMTFIRRVIEPPILGNAMKLHPLLTLISMVFGISFFGLAGLFLGPVLLVIAREILIVYGLSDRLRRLAADIQAKIVGP